MLSETVRLAQEMIRRPSVSPEDAGCQSVIADRLKRIGFDIRFLNSGAVTNLWARIGTESPMLTYVGHTDVVPPGDLSSWKHPPFAAIVDGEFLHGRGAADMKGSVAAMVTACERFVSMCGSNVPGSLSLLITSDEEDVAEEGTRYALEALGDEAQQIQWCLVGEPTSESVLGDTMKVGRRGSLDGTIVVHGKQGHVAYPHLADNPIHASGKLIAALAELKWDDGNDDFPNTTMQISNVNSGVGAKNVIPPDLTIHLNFRFSPDTPADRLVGQVEQICNDLGIRCSLHWSSPSAPYHTRKRFFAGVVADAAGKILNRKPERSTAGGTSDGRFVARTCAEVVEFGPLNSTIHKIDECVNIADLDKLSQVYEQILTDLYVRPND